jgi:5-oxopent-3-ene-1,2,5-tricarboxylate decarboxylase / 2-hydroxyhepta-2,4-diene-1,7-dioate isomerase
MRIGNNGECMVVAVAKIWGMANADRIDADPSDNAVRQGGRSVPVASLGWEVPTRGAVFGILLNHEGALAAIGKSRDEAPVSPMLYVKPANTWIGYGATIPLAGGVGAVEVGASLAVVIGATASGVDAGRAEDCILGYTIANDIGEPQIGLTLPSVRQRCRDGYCAIGPWVVARHEMPPIDTLAIRVLINGALACESGLSGLVRSPAQLVAEVSSFITLCPGDVLLTGIAPGAPIARVGDRVRIEVDGIGALENTVAAEDGFVAGARP